MQLMELHVESMASAVDFMDALKKVIGAPDWHGDSVDAFLDSMIHPLKSPSTIRIVGADKLGREAQDAIRRLARAINQHGASDRGGDLEVTILVEE
jgi:RNAse (barnase) inhibitor barstar